MMAYEVHDTIAAIASPAGGAARGVVRISGPDAIACVSRCFEWVSNSAGSFSDVVTPRRVPALMRMRGDEGLPLEIPGDLLLWPSSRSYTREPAAEFHTLGSPPLLNAVIEALSKEGVRPAGAGEFTLRAFLAGRMDLTQAEAVLGVIDAHDRSDLDAALDQLAGGLSRPLHLLRGQLLAVLAELEAGLDFVEEDIEFISREALCERLRAAEEVVGATIEQMTSRNIAGDLPRVVISGLPNVGKSSLFNALVKRYGVGHSADAIVSPQPGATRDYVAAEFNLKGVRCELVDTAGIGEQALDGLDEAAQSTAGEQRRRASLRLVCLDAATADPADVKHSVDGRCVDELQILTKADLSGVVGNGADDLLLVSSLTGRGLDELAGRLHERIIEATGAGQGGSAAATAARCSSSLRTAERALAAAVTLVASGSEELIAAEIRAALDALGEVVGAICTDDVLDRVFSQFCIGK